MDEIKKKSPNQLKNFLYKELSGDRNDVDGDLGYAFEYQGWPNYSKKMYLKYKWFTIMDSIDPEIRKDAIVDNVALADIVYYLILGYKKFSGSFTSGQLFDWYGTDAIYDRDYDNASLIIVDPISGLFKYNNNDTTNDMDNFGYQQRYGSTYVDKIICLLWGVVEVQGLVMVKVSEGFVIPFVPHKLFYLFYSKDIFSKKRLSFHVHDSRLSSITIRAANNDIHMKKRVIHPYAYACVMNLLRDYVIVTPDILYEEGILSKSALYTFVERACERIPSCEFYHLSYQIKAHCYMYSTSFSFRNTNSNFVMDVVYRRIDFDQKDISSVKSVEIEPKFRPIKTDIERSFAIDNSMSVKDTLVIEANANLPTTVSAFKYLRYSQVAARDSDLKMFVPRQVFKEYATQDLRKAHNSTY